MKPQRQLAIPCRPCFVDEMRKGEACVKIPETRLDKLFKTERFKGFLRTHLDWLRPECRIQPNSEVVICRSDILPERIREEDANDRDKRQFEEDFESAKQESTGERAFSLYEKYVQGKVVIDGELASQKFLEVAVGKQWPAAVARNNLEQAERKLRSGFVELDLSVVEKVCADVRAFIGREGRSDITPAQFVNHWFEHKEEWGRFCNELERASYDEGDATCNVVMFGVEGYNLLGPKEKSMFMKYLSAVAVAKTQYKGRGDYGTEVDLFVKMLRDVCG